MDKIYTELASQLLAVENVLREMNLWSEATPSPDVFLSDQPFSVDRLAFYEWLQFIFLPRMQRLVAATAPLPKNCNIAPMAEEYFSGSSSQSSQLIELLKSIDNALSHH